MALTLCLLAGCTGPHGNQSTAPPGTGIQGTAMMGPTCPVETNPPDPNCADRPYHGRLRVTQGDDPTVTITTFSTAADGTFSVTVGPGVYRLQTPGDQSLPTCYTQDTITVVAGAVSHAEVECDTGIR